MAAQKVILSTVTETSIVDGIIIINTFYLEDTLPNTIQATIADSIGVQDGIPFTNGELLLKLKNFPADISYFIDGNGNLILTVDTDDGENYSIDENGNLIYTIIE